MGDNALLKAHNALLQKLGESEKLRKDTLNGGEIMIYDFDEFEANFGTIFHTGSGEYLLCYSVFKKNIIPKNDIRFLIACQSGSVKDIEELIKLGVNLEARNEFGDTALILALMENENHDVATALIKSGADVNAVGEMSSNHITPLICALSRDELNLDLVLALLKAGADVNSVDKEQSTPLMIAVCAQNPNVEIIELLLKAGANPKAKDDEGRMVIDFAKENEKLKNTDIYWKLNDLSY